jgi:hypothetical protein
MISKQRFALEMQKIEKVYILYAFEQKRFALEGDIVINSLHVRVVNRVFGLYSLSTH